MKWLSVFAGVVVLSHSIIAQELVPCAPPAPKTLIGAFDERPGSLIIKGSTPMGTIGCIAGSVLVICKESTDVVSTQKVFGAAVSVKGRDRSTDTALLDAEELDLLLRALPRMNGPQWGETAMTSFEAVWNSKDGLRVTTFNNANTGAIEATIQSTHYPVQAVAVGYCALCTICARSCPCEAFAQL